MNKKKSYVALLSLLAMMTIVFIGCSNGGTCYEGSVYKIYGEYVSATDLGKTIKKVTSIGTSTPSGWAAGANRTSN
jgi:hypothetical protein